MALQAGLQWQRFSAGRARVKADAQLTETELKTNDLILIGAPDNNSVIARLRDHLPIKWTEEEYVVGNRKFPASGNGLLVIYPSPFSGGRDEGRGTRGEGRGEGGVPRPASPVPRPPSRYVLVNSGLLWGEHLSVNHKWDFVPDFIIYNDEKDWDDNNKYLCAGYFDKRWRLDDSLIWLGKDEKDAQKAK
jgi:hypothetical protein